MILPKKTTLDNMSKVGISFPKKNSEYAADMKTFFKGLFGLFLGLTSLYLVNIQPNSKFSGSAPKCGIEDFFRTPPPL